MTTQNNTVHNDQNIKGIISEFKGMVKDLSEGKLTTPELTKMLESVATDKATVEVERMKQYYIDNATHELLEVNKKQRELIATQADEMTELLLAEQSAKTEVKELKQQLESTEKAVKTAEKEVERYRIDYNSAVATNIEQEHNLEALEHDYTYLEKKYNVLNTSERNTYTVKLATAEASLKVREARLETTIEELKEDLRAVKEINAIYKEQISKYVAKSAVSRMWKALTK